MYRLKKKRSALLNKKVCSVFHTIFKFDFMMQTIYCIHTSVFSFHTFQTGHSKNNNPSLFILVVKVQQNKRKQKRRGIRVRR